MDKVWSRVDVRNTGDGTLHLKVDADRKADFLMRYAKQPYRVYLGLLC